MKTRKASKALTDILKRLDTALDEKIAKLYPYEEPGNYSGKLDDEFGRNLRNGVIDIIRKVFKDGYKEGFRMGGNKMLEWIEENNNEIISGGNGGFTTKKALESEQCITNCDIKNKEIKL
jgi:hypothetical protein